MSSALTTRQPPKAPEDDPWRYGERHVPHVGRDGKVFYETVPLKKEDLLFPEEGDRPVITQGHRKDAAYLVAVFESRARRRGWYVFGDHRIDFEVPGLKPLGPDVLVVRGIDDWDDYRGTFPVAAMRAEPLLAIEVTSPDTRPLDLDVKPDLYYQCGVPCYAIVDLQGDTGTDARVLAYRVTGRRYVPIPPDSRGRVWLEPVALALGVVDGRAACFDKRGRRIPSPPEQAATEFRMRKKAQKQAEERAAEDAATRRRLEQENAELQRRVAELEAQAERSKPEGTS